MKFIWFGTSDTQRQYPTLPPWYPFPTSFLWFGGEPLIHALVDVDAVFRRYYPYSYVVLPQGE